MYRKLAFASIALNIVQLGLLLYVFVPWFMNIARFVKIEMPAPVLWLIHASNFATNPVTILSSLSLLLIAVISVKALRKPVA
jgi:type II secretory pathway component PulF